MTEQPVGGANDLTVSLLESLEHAAAIFDAERRVLHANNQFRSLELLTAGETAVPRRFSDIVERIMAVVPSGERPALRDRLCERANAPDGRGEEFPTVTERLFRYRLAPLPGGKVLFSLADVTEQRRTERLATYRANQLAAILEHVPHGVTYLDSNGDLVLANDEFYDSFDFPREMGPGTPGLDFTRLILARQLGLEGEELERTARERMARIYRECENDRISTDIEYLDDGRVIEIRRRVPSDGSLVETYVDVTERERQAVELRAAAGRYRAVVEDQTEMICRFDADFRITFANGAYRAAFQRPGEDLSGSSLLDLIPDTEARSAIVEGLGRLTPQNPLVEDTYRETTVSGVQTWQTWINRAIFDADGTLLEYQAVGRDVTAEHEAQEALAQSEKLSAMGSLLANVSHELNNPLSIVVGQSQLLESVSDDPAVAERIGKIRAAANRCAGIVRTFLAMARQKPRARTPVDLGKLAREALELTEYTLRTGSIEVHAELGEGPVVVNGDRDQLIQVIVNLLVNAQQALSDRPAGRRIAIGIEADGGCANLFVSDNGSGIPEGLRSKIFEPFFTTKPEGSGTGIGLAVSRSIIAAHGGNLDVRMSREGGAEFRFSLPRPDISSAEAITLDTAMDAWEKLPPLKILFVDDDMEIANTARDFLEPGGHDVVTAADGADALERLETNDIDLVISDLRMPGMDGPALFRAIEEQGLVELSRIGFVTGDTLGVRVQEFLDRTSAPLLEKPFTGDELRGLVVRVLASDG